MQKLRNENYDLTSILKPKRDNTEHD